MSFLYLDNRTAPTERGVAPGRQHDAAPAPSPSAGTDRPQPQPPHSPVTAPSQRASSHFNPLTPSQRSRALSRQPRPARMRAPPPSLHYRENRERAARHPGSALRDNMAVESRVTQEEIKKEPEKPIDREKTCPLLLRVFTTNNGRHHRMDEFSRGNVPSSELQIYTWMDATLKELTSLVKEVYPEARKKGTHFNFAIVFTDLKRPGYRVKEIGSTMSGRKGTDDSMTLQSQKFQIGDYLDIAITPPNRAPPPSSRMRPY
ncbi:histone deacetylase complex subunit SAP18 [Coturnix japonica]|nr:histone deacetylase complex subunit SAP18 [Coturnix japonica]